MRDRIEGATFALKILPPDASEDEVDALVREASALSGLEGLGVPRVKRFGRLRSQDRVRVFLVREICEGESFADRLDRRTNASELVTALALAADRLTTLHRAKILHGDIKPANIILGEDGATLVDLGLAAAMREGGAKALGLTPRYAAPELLAGGPLTVRAEVYSLGGILREILDTAKPDMATEVNDALRAVADRALKTADERFPSADEFASALRGAAKIPDRTRAETPAWPIVALEDPSRELLTNVENLAAGHGIVIVGPAASGRTTLARRVAWTLGARGRDIVWIEPAAIGPSELSSNEAIELEAKAVLSMSDAVVIVDDLEQLDADARRRVSELRSTGARLLTVIGAGTESPDLDGPTLEVFAMRPLPHRAAKDVVLRAVPSLGERVVEHLIELSGGWPGPLRKLISLVADAPVVSPADVDDILARVGELPHKKTSPSVDLSALERALDRGHYDDAAEILEGFEEIQSFELDVARARLWTNRGEARAALALFEKHAESGARAGRQGAHFSLHEARAHLRAGDYADASVSALRVGKQLEQELGRGEVAALTTFAEAKSVYGLAKSFEAKPEEAHAALDEAVEIASRLRNDRLLSVTWGSLAFAQQRADRLSEAEESYERALGAAERAGDAGSVATTRLNLASLAKTRGDLALSIAHLEAAVDMGKKSGRIATLRQAMLNLANLDLYVGRLSRARLTIERLDADRADLPPQQQAQLYALHAEAEALGGDREAAMIWCGRCAAHYDALHRPVDAAEARLEGVLFALYGTVPTAQVLSKCEAELRRAAQSLEGTAAHQALHGLVRAKFAQASGNEPDAHAAIERAIESARSTGQKEWLWRALEVKSEQLVELGQSMAARQARDEALSIVEEVAAKLPGDLREVFWNEPRRKSLKLAVGEPSTRDLGASTEHSRSIAAQSGVVLKEDRLARILEINRELAGTYDLRRLLERVTDHAIALLQAERGFVILKSSRSKNVEPAANAVEPPPSSGRSLDLSIHAARADGESDPHARFSQSIADKVVTTGEVILTTAAQNDARMADYVSVHQLMLQSVACVPIRSRERGIIGALYLETRLRPRATFNEELPLLMALADQVAIAIDTAHLWGENEKRTAELGAANRELEAAHAKLEELLGHRTAQLEQTRRDLKSARAVLRSHFGYAGLVGTSEAMRRVYALIDRIRDTDIPVLILGESGTGKEIVARAIHSSGPRAKKPFVGINCGAIPAELLESELFGHVRGAFTGADRDRKGLFREATDGSILLDEIGEMPHKMQAGLLRVLQEKVVRPVGGTKEETVETRVIAATHRDLSAMVADGSFREDLYYRLNVIQVRVPPLRERLDDIPVLIDHFLGIFAARYSRDRRSVSRAALKMLMAQRWPGNVRQLENVLLNAWVLSDRDELEVDDFDVVEKPHSEPSSRGGHFPSSLEGHRSDEKDRILAALGASNWNRVKAAELIDMPRRTFYRRLKAYGIQ